MYTKSYIHSEFVGPRRGYLHAPATLTQSKCSRYAPSMSWIVGLETLLALMFRFQMFLLVRVQIRYWITTADNLNCPVVTGSSLLIFTYNITHFSLKQESTVQAVGESSSTSRYVSPETLRLSHSDTIFWNIYYTLYAKFLRYFRVLITNLPWIATPNPPELITHHTLTIQTTKTSLFFSEPSNSWWKRMSLGPNRS
jgi:hypothetical protein